MKLFFSRNLLCISSMNSKQLFLSTNSAILTRSSVVSFSLLFCPALLSVHLTTLHEMYWDIVLQHNLLHDVHVLTLFINMININKKIVLSCLKKFEKYYKKNKVEQKWKDNNHIKIPVLVHFNDKDFSCF